MKLKKTIKKIKFYLGISFIIALFIMIRVAWKNGKMMCGIYTSPGPCGILPWIFQTLIFTIGISILLFLIVTALKAIIRYIPEIKSRRHKKKEDKKAIKKEAKKEKPKKGSRKEEPEEEEEKPKKKEEIIRI